MSEGSKSGVKLNPLERQAERMGQRFRQRSLPDAGDVLDQQMSVGEQNRKRKFHCVRFA